jgi:hypothetical protein
MKTFLRVVIALFLFQWLAIEVFLAFGLFLGGGVFSSDLTRVIAAAAVWSVIGFVLALCAFALR